jgi:2,3-bisphosphoglycerate-dependent phosphoglycerate mutase
MKLFALLLFVGITLFSAREIAGQDKLIILVRHAEKADEMTEDPELSPAGRERAERLRKMIGKYRPGAFHSTDLKRTRDTIAAFAEKRGKQTVVYDARQPQQLFDLIVKSPVKRHLVVGHSNTIPGLANVITGKELFKNLQDSEYGTIWLIRIKNGKFDRAEILPY